MAPTSTVQNRHITAGKKIRCCCQSYYEINQIGELLLYLGQAQKLNSDTHPRYVMPEYISNTVCENHTVCLLAFKMGRNIYQVSLSIDLNGIRV